MERPFHRGETLFRMVDLRNRIVHPSRSEDVRITDADLISVDRALETIFYLVCESLSRCARAHMTRLDQTRRLIYAKWPGRIRRTYLGHTSQIEMAFDTPQPPVSAHAPR